MFPRAAVQMYGARALDQAFLDETIEAGIAGCGFAPPALRADPRIAERPKAAVAAKPQKPSLFKRALGKS